MRGAREERIESAIDQIAAALLGAALGFVAYRLGPLPMVQRALAMAAVAAPAYFVALVGLRRVGAEPARFSVRTFHPPELEIVDVDELVLTEADRFKAAVETLLLTDADRFRPQPDELMLDDILAELGPNSRVVRLFDPAAMPTPAQLNAQIQRHLRDGAPQTQPADASQALYEALSELRRSLR